MRENYHSINYKIGLEAEELAEGIVIKGATKNTNEEEKGGAKKPRRRVIAKK